MVRVSSNAEMRSPFKEGAESASTSPSICSNPFNLKCNPTQYNHSTIICNIGNLVNCFIASLQNLMQWRHCNLKRSHAVGWDLQNGKNARKYSDGLTREEVDIILLLIISIQMEQKQHRIKCQMYFLCCFGTINSCLSNFEDCGTISCTLKDDLPRVFWNPLLSRDRTGQEIGTIHRKPSNFDHVQRVCLSPEKTPFGMKNFDCVFSGRSQNRNNPWKPSNFWFSLRLYDPRLSSTTDS